MHEEVMHEELIKRLYDAARDAAMFCERRYATLLREAADALSRPAPAVQVPDGWMLVPVEPTLWMQQAALSASRANVACGMSRMLTDGCELWAAGEVYKTMLAAAPSAPAVPVGDGWMPIETAPTDTEILIGAFIDGEWHWGRSVRFYESANEFEGETFSGWVWSIDDVSESVAESPTHWRNQPLPPAPSVNGEG